MFPKQLAHLYRRLRYSLNFLRPALVLLFLAISSSCTDQGCIEADDFGEYESQTIEVSTNESQSNCDYDPSKSLTDMAQGLSLRDPTSGCFVTGSQTITPESGGSPITSSPGCNSFASEANKRTCAELCVEKCIASLGSSSDAEPNWQSTDEKVSGKNVGVTIRPGSEIMIRASGAITLGDSATYSPIYIQADSIIPHSKAEDWSTLNFDVRADQTINLAFSGQWNDNTTGSGGNFIGSGSDATNLSRAVNGAKKLIPFLIPHPEGYGFNSSNGVRTAEKDGTTGVPLLPDPSTWKCEYSGTDTKQGVCSYKDNPYTSIGYANVDDDAAMAAFPISSDLKTTTLGKYGGILRWNNDGLESTASFNPFQSVTCDPSNGTCTNVSTIDANKGRMIGEASSIYITNNSSFAYEASFKALTSSSSCNTTLSVSVKDSSDATLYSFPIVTVTNSGWSNNKISVERGQKLVITHDSTGTAISSNCKKTIAVRFNRYHDISITQSGLLRFTMLGGNSESCTLVGRIINPNGVHTGGTLADFYEHDNFATTPSTDPLNSLRVGGTMRSVNEATAMNWSKRVFVRKGQIIRFSPDSWNGSWTTQDGVARQCGIGMAMTLEPKPAVICPVIMDDYVDNPNCVPDIKDGILIGCKVTSPACNNPSPPASAYCPIEYCQYKLNCTAGVAPDYLKTGCTKGTEVNDATRCNSITGNDGFRCSECADAMLAVEQIPAKTPLSSIFICYDLENYTGKLANVVNKTTRATVDSFLASASAKGAVELRSFNGYYGNLSNFSRKPSASNPGNFELETNGNIIYQSRSSLTFSKSGRLRFFVADGASFNDSNGAIEEDYSNNTPHSALYSGSNGMKITPSGTLEFNNGQWLQIKLCEEIRNSAGNLVYTCKSNSEPSSVPGGYPKILEISRPNSAEQASQSPNIGDSNYMFDSSGNLYRVTGALDKDCKVDPHGISTTPGIYTYCHTYRYGGTSDQIKDLRLTFKIIDPEFGNCQISDPSNNSMRNANSPSWDGLITKNPHYAEPNCDTANPSAERPTVKNGVAGSSGGVRTCIAATGVGQMCGANESISVEPACKKEFYCANRYSNNTGKYLVNVKVKNPVSGAISNIVSDVITPVVEIMDGPQDGSKMGQAERVYKLIISDSRYKAILNMCLVVMFTFYGFGYLMGVSELSHNQIIDRIIKIGLIYLFVGEAGWYWFDKIAVKFFKNGTDQIAFLMASSFDDSPELAQAIQNNSYYDKSILFGGVDKVFGLFFAQTVQKKISALLFASIFGWAYLIIIYMSFMLYVYAVANAVLIYLTAQVFISILFTLGPIFFIFTLFKQTKDMFDAWLNHIISFSLQQIFLLTTLAFFNMMMYEVIKMSLGYKICWEEVWTINIITPISLLSFWTIASLPPRTDSNSNVGNIGNNEGIPSLFSILFIWVIASLMGKFITMMSELAQSLAGGASASKLSAGIKAIAGEIKKNVGGIIKEYGWTKTGGSDLMKRLDQKLFNSGEYAERERKLKKEQYALDSSKKSQLSSHANNAIQDHKIKNAAKLQGMSEKERLDELRGVKEKALQEKAKELGIGDSELKRLRSDKGLKTTSDNPFVAALQAGKQMVNGTLTKSIDDNDVKANYSHEEAREAMKSMNAEERKNFMQSAKDGNIRIDKKASDKALDAVKGLGSGAKKIFTQNPLRTAKEGIKAAGRGLKSMAKKTGIHDEEYKKAEQELVDLGAIPEMRSGTGFSRTDKEKKDIRERQRQNAAAMKLGVKQKQSSVDALDALEREHAYQSRIEEIDKSDDNFVVKKAKKAAARIGRAGANKYTAKGRARRSKALADMKESAQRSVEGKIATATAKQAKLAGIETKAHETLAEANDAFESHRQSSGIAQLEQTGKKRSLAARSLSSQARKEHEDYKKAQAAKSTPEYAKVDNARKQAQVALTRVKQEQANVQAQIGGLQKIKSNITHAQEIDAQRRDPAHEDVSSQAHKGVIEQFGQRLDVVQQKKGSLEARRTALTNDRKRLAANAGPIFGSRTPAQQEARDQMDKIDAELGTINSHMEGLDQREEGLGMAIAQMEKAQDIVNRANKAKKAAEPNSRQYRKAEAVLKKYNKINAKSDPKDFEESLRDFAESGEVMEPDLEDLSDSAFWRAVDVDGVEKETRSHRSSSPMRAAGPTAPRPTRRTNTSGTDE